jgi:HEAT repeat protein
MSARLAVSVTVSVLLAIPALAAPPPRLTHTPVVSQSAAGAGFEKAVRAWAAAQTAPGWLGYEVPAAGQHDMCCFDSWEGSDRRGGACRIEEHGSFSTRDSDERSASLDDDTAVVLLRAEQGRIGRVRVVSLGCGIDAGGRTLTWVDDVKPAESLAVLSSLVSSGDEATAQQLDGGRSAGRDKVTESALMAIAVHEGPAADDVLERFLAPTQPERIRKKAAFWMGNMRGRRGYEALSRLVRDDPSDKVREQGVFALSQSEVPEAVDAMIRVAQKDASTHVRGQALFWLGQKAGKKAVAAITGAIAEDPETEVKKKAVVALSQLPKEEGVPMLIQVAKTNRNPEVRKQAMFWLGQSGDSRALAFFQDMLSQPRQGGRRWGARAAATVLPDRFHVAALRDPHRRPPLESVRSETRKAELRGREPAGLTRPASRSMMAKEKRNGYRAQGRARRPPALPPIAGGRAPTPRRGCARARAGHGDRRTG